MDKAWYQSKTVWFALCVAAVGVLAVIGNKFDLEIGMKALIAILAVLGAGSQISLRQAVGRKNGGGK